MASPSAWGGKNAVAGGGSAWGGKPTSAPSAKTGGGGGFLGGVTHLAHWTAGKAELAGHDLKSIPGGLFALGEATVKSTDPLIGIAQSHIPHVPGVPGTFQPNQQGAPTLGTIAKGVGKQTLETVEHPLRDPFLTLTTLAPAARLAGSAAIRAGAASSAVRAGDGVAAAAKAARATPDLGPRLITKGDAKIPLYASKNPAVRLVQAGYDKVIQHALDTNPDSRLGAHAAKRVGGSLQETGRYQTRIREAPAALVERAGQKLGPLKLSPKRLVSDKVPRKVQEAALRLTSENSTADEAANFHRLQAQKGVAIKDNLKQARLYDLVAKRGLLTKDAQGNVVVNAADHPQLAKLDAEIARGQAQVDKIASDHGLMTDEQLQARRNGPARIRVGAHYEAPTPGKQGVPSQSLVRQRAQVARLQTLHDRATESLKQTAAKTAGPRDAVIGTKVVGPGAETVTTAAGDIAATRARLVQLEREHNVALDKIAAAKHGPIDMAEVRFRTRENMKAARQESGKTKNGRASGASGTKSTTRPTVKEERRSQIEQAVEDAIAKNPADPALKLWRQRTAEIDRLRGMLNPDEIGKAPKGVRQGPGRVVSPPGTARTQRLGSALSLAKERLTQMESAAQKRVQPTGVVGGTGAREGRGFVSYRTAEPKRAKGQVASAASPVVGKQRSFIPNKAITYKGLEHGQVPDNTSRLVAQHMRDAYRYVNTDQFRRTVLTTGSKLRRTSRDVLVLEPDAEAVGKIDAATEQILGKTASTIGELDAVKDGFDAWRQQLVPGLRDNFAKDRAEGIGAEAPKGYKWVDRKVLGDLGKPGPGPRNALGGAADKLNTLVTSATVYFKLGHIGTRVFTNAATNILQGSATPRNIAYAAKLWEQLTPLERAKALAASGQHSFSALPLSDESGVISKSISGAGRVGAQWWARHVDSPFRFNSIAYEARKAGFDTPTKFRDLLDRLENPHDYNMNAAEAAKVDYVAKRANREGIAYDRLSDTERRYITRAFWFYPWTAGAARFAVNTLLEHPYKAGALGTAGGLGRKQQAAQLGDLPSYEGGLFKIAGGGNTPTVADFSTFSPFSTGGELLQAPSVGNAADYLNPAYAALFRLAARENQYGQHSNTPVSDAVGSVFSPAPEAQLFSALRHRHDDQSARMFKKTPRNVFARALVGPGLPRKINLTAAHKAAARERSGR